MSSPAPDQPGWSPFVDDESFDHFWRLVTEHAADRGDIEADRAGGVIKLDLGDQKVECGVLNLAQLCAHAPGDEWRGIVAAQFEMLDGPLAFQQLERLIQDRALAERHLRLRLAPTPLLEAQNIHRLDLPQDLSVALAFDVEGSCVYVGRERLDSWRAGTNELLLTGAEQVRKRVRVRSRFRHRFGGRHLHLHGASLFVTGHLFNLDRHISGAWGQRGALITFPTARDMLAIPLDRRTGLIDDITATLATTAHAFADGPNSLSTDMWWWRPGHDLEPALRLVSGRLKVTAQGELAWILASAVDDAA